MFMFFKALSHVNHFNPANISNYMSGIRTFFLIYHFHTHIFRNEKIQMFVRLLKINRHLVVRNTSVFTDLILLNIIIASSKLEFPKYLSPSIFWYF